MDKKTIIVGVSLIISGIVNFVNCSRIDRLEKEVDRCSEIYQQALDDADKFLKANKEFQELAEKQLEVSTYCLGEIYKLTKNGVVESMDDIDPNEFDVTIDDEREVEED